MDGCPVTDSKAQRKTGGCRNEFPAIYRPGVDGGISSVEAEMNLPAGGGCSKVSYEYQEPLVLQ